ncbi:MAG: hypothetical protein IT234_04970 [Bacteroidia bacterium]|nr:hypothetical protein [Bacteroidia bacterium]
MSVASNLLQKASFLQDLKENKNQRATDLILTSGVKGITPVISLLFFE